LSYTLGPRIGVQNANGVLGIQLDAGDDPDPANNLRNVSSDYVRHAPDARRSIKAAGQNRTVLLIHGNGKDATVMRNWRAERFLGVRVPKAGGVVRAAG